MSITEAIFKIQGAVRTDSPKVLFDLVYYLLCYVGVVRDDSITASLGKEAHILFRIYRPRVNAHAATVALAHILGDKLYLILVWVSRLRSHIVFCEHIIAYSLVFFKWNLILIFKKVAVLDTL